MIIFILICAIYSVLIISLIYGWKKLPDFTSEGFPEKICFSILIPFRNEAENLPALLESIAEINYPKSQFEILMINDDSQDIGVKIIEGFQQKNLGINLKILRNIRSSNSPKKDAIHTAMASAKFDYILTTDADCEVSENWLKVYNDFLQSTKSKLVAGLVSLKLISKTSRGTLLRNFEEIDVLSLQTSAGGVFGIGQAFLCSAANLCYEKQAFLNVSGYDGNTEIASGDDVFLLQKFQQKNYKTSFLKNSENIVYTQAQQNFGDLVSQRIRWASKTSSYKGFFPKFTGIAVFAMNFSLIIAAFLVFFQVLSYHPILLIFLVKFILDFILIYQSAKIFKRKTALRNYFWSSIFYPFFSSYVAIKSLFSDYHWKGRRFKK